MAKVSTNLKEYRKKRDFRATGEPRGGEGTRGAGNTTKQRRRSGRSSRSSGLVFVVQQHHATHAHFDFRLELDGVLKSWAVPKGPSMDPADKRLAVQVEDHPVEYGGFEGTIPEGQYGAGRVLLWDRGTWRMEDEGEDAAAAYRAGRMKINLAGRKLKGGFALVRMKARPGEKRTNWLLMKEKDTFARRGYDVTARETRSVKSGKVIGEIGESSPTWDSNKSGAPKSGGTRPKRGRSKVSSRRTRGSKLPDASELEGAVEAAMPRAFSPELCTLRDEAPDGPEWLHEVKFDGYRILAFIRNGAVRLLTRRGKDWTERFPRVRDAIERMGFENGILDGELVVLNEKGLSEFRLLQNALREGKAAALTYFVFDVVYWGGYDLTGCAFSVRREFLEKVLRAGSSSAAGAGVGRVVRLSETIEGRGGDVITQACRLGLEGIVSKRIDSPYVSERTGSWVKVKCSNRQEMVIAGYTEPRRSRTGFGALLLGYYNGAGELEFAGKVGTGFDEAQLRAILKKLKAIEVERPPVVNPPRGADAAGAHWVEPTLVAEVEFTEWTGDGKLRHPAFVGLREDKAATDVVRERVQKRKPRAELARVTGRAATSPRRSADARGESGVVEERPPSPSRRRTKAASRRGQREGDSVLGVTITHPERELFEGEGITKRDLASYYELVAPWILPHAGDRPLSLLRCPAGAGGQCFFQKHPDFNETPRGIELVPITESKGTKDYVSVTAAEGLVFLAQMNTLELHGWGSKSDNIEKPDRLVLDLDPGEAVEWEQIAEAALDVRQRLKSRGLESFVKTTGGKGLHVVVPIRRGMDWDAAKAWAKALADEMAETDPGLYVATMSKALRKGKVFVDYLRNQRGATSVVAYSSRAREGATVSMPIRWSEVDSVRPLHFTVGGAAAYLKKRRKDPWEGFFDVKQAPRK